MTIVVDTSALVAVVLGEDDADRYAQVIRTSTQRLAISAATLVEAVIVVEARQGLPAVQDLYELLEAGGITVEPLTQSQAEGAVAAWRRFGRGRHPAALNFGDCFAYGLAGALDAVLLFKGDDFARTDARAALQ